MNAFPKWLFAVAGVYGLLVIAPLYFREAQIAQDYPPAITHPEYFYGFIGVTLAWQVLFILLSLDPVKYRLLILPAVLEKVAYAGAIAILFAEHRVPPLVLGFGLVDLTLGVLFAVAFYLLPRGSGTGRW